MPAHLPHVNQLLPSYGVAATLPSQRPEPYPPIVSPLFPKSFGKYRICAHPQRRTTVTVAVPEGPPERQPAREQHILPVGETTVRGTSFSIHLDWLRTTAGAPDPLTPFLQGEIGRIWEILPLHVYHPTCPKRNLPWEGVEKRKSAFSTVSRRGWPTTHSPES